MTVAVVLPTLGRVERLARAMASIVEQTHTPQEVAVVDGSTDRAAAEVLDERDWPFETRYIYQTEDTGLSGARNLGIEATDSDLLSFLDDDDEWRPEKLERQVATQERTGAGLVFCGIENVRPDGTVTNVTRATEVPDGRSILAGNSIGSPSAVLARRSDVEAVGGFDEGLPTREEWDFYIRMLQRTEAAAVPAPLVRKEYNPGGMSRNVEHSKRDRMAVFEKHREKYDPAMERHFRANYHFALGRRYAKSGDTRRARQHFFRSLQVRPGPKQVPYLLAACLGSRGYNALRRIREGT